MKIFQKPIQIHASNISEDSFEIEKNEQISPSVVSEKDSEILKTGLPVCKNRWCSKKCCDQFRKIKSPADVTGLTPKSEMEPLNDPILRKMKTSYNRRLAKYQRDRNITPILRDLHQWREWYICTMVKNKTNVANFTEEEIDTLSHAQLVDKYIANVMISLESLMNFFSKIRFYDQLSPKLKQNLVKRHAMMAAFLSYVPQWEAAPTRPGEKYDYTSETVVMGGWKLDFNFYAKIWTTPHTKRAFTFCRNWSKILGEDTRLLVLLMIYMIFDNPDSFYSNEEERELCNTIRKRTHVSIKVLCHSIRKPFQLFEFWFK